MKVRLQACLLAFLVLAFWQMAVQLEWVSPILLPAPLDIARYLLESTLDGVLPQALWVTLWRLFIGYFLGLLLGIFLGFLLYRSALMRSTVGVVALGLQTLPSVCWAPLAILWFGQTESAMYFVVIMGSMWAVTIATENAIQSVPPLYIRAARVMGSTGLHTWRTIIFPATLPQLLNGAKLGWAFAWRSLMAAEIYVMIIANMGLGQLLHFGRELNAMDQAMAVMVVIVVIGFLTDRLLFMPAERYLRRTRGLNS
ncbi:ABC transporter permease [Oxalobacter sp. OttesenSCG-928-P03]|nr:ABC transporter permease [Oxalobacter sp. OttesenSCG-928-P03]